MRKTIQGACPERSRRGFTIIEMITVIAIIGILAGIVLVAWNSSRTKAKNARIEVDVTQLGLDAITYGEAHGRDWSAYCEQGLGTNFKNLTADIATHNGNTVPVCHATDTAWAISAITNDSSSICADSTGVIKSGVVATAETAKCGEIEVGAETGTVYTTVSGAGGFNCDYFPGVYTVELRTEIDGAGKLIASGKIEENDKTAKNLTISGVPVGNYFVWGYLGPNCNNLNNNTYVIVTSGGTASASVNVTDN